MDQKTREKSKWITVRDWAKLRDVVYSGLYKYANDATYSSCVKKVNGKTFVKYPEMDDLLNSLQDPKGKASAEVRRIKAGKLPVERGMATSLGEDDDGDNVSTSDILKSKKEKEFYQAQNEKLKFERASGLLIEKAAVEKKVFETGRVIRNKILSIPDRVCSQLSGMKNPQKIRILLYEELVESLTELSNQLGTAFTSEEVPIGSDVTD